MRPDYPHKIFPDFRSHFFLLMETLAIDGVPISCRGIDAFLWSKKTIVFW